MDSEARYTENRPGLVFPPYWLQIQKMFHYYLTYRNGLNYKINTTTWCLVMRSWPVKLIKLTQS